MMRTRPLVLAAVLPLVFALTPRATAQTPELEVFYQKLEPKAEFKYKWQGKEAEATAGVFRWEIPKPEEGGSFGTSGLDRNFTGYCAEILVPITAGKLYKFKVNNLYDPSNFGLAPKDDKEPSEKALNAAVRRVTLVKELFGRFYRDPMTQTVSDDEKIAAQLALWEVIQETEPAEGDPKLDLFGGDFQANYDRAKAPAYVTKAQEYLDALTGDEAPYYSNPDLRGRELIRLQGIENAEKVVAQSQFALRYAGGGGVGGSAATSRPLTSGGFAAGGGAPVAGFGTGGGFGAGSGGGGGSTTPNTNTPPATPPNVTTEQPPTGGPQNPEFPPPQPPPPGDDTPPPGIPNLFDFPPSPVPAPAGLVLGAIALGTLGSWRLGVKLLGKK